MPPLLLPLYFNLEVPYFLVKRKRWMVHGSFYSVSVFQCLFSLICCIVYVSCVWIAVLPPLLLPLYFNLEIPYFLVKRKRWMVCYTHCARHAFNYSASLSLNRTGQISRELTKTCCYFVRFLLCDAMYSADYAVARCLSVQHTLVLCSSGLTCHQTFYLLVATPF